MPTNSQKIAARRRELYIQDIANIRIPNEYYKTFRKLKFSKTEEVFAASIWRMEQTARPSWFQILEFIYALYKFVIASIFRSTLRNITLGPFQIGILSSLKWTLSPVTPSNYFHRIFLLMTPTASIRLFRIGLHRFIRSHKNKDNLFLQFAIFYNGQPTKDQFTISYEEILSSLVCREMPVFYMSHSLNSCVQANRMSMQFKLPYKDLDYYVERRLNKIRAIAVNPEELCASIFICSLFQRKIVYAKTYGPHQFMPAIQSRREIGSLMKIGLYSAYLNQFPVELQQGLDTSS